MKQFLTIITIVLCAFTNKSFSQGTLTINNSSTCTIYMTFDAMATSTGDTACSIQGNQIILSASAGVSYHDAIDFETTTGWAVNPSTYPYITNGIPSDFIWTDVSFNGVCDCSNWINGYIGDGGTNCFGPSTTHSFVGKTPDNGGGYCALYAQWLFDDNGNPYIIFHN